MSHHGDSSPQCCLIFWELADEDDEDDEHEATWKLEG